MSLPASEMLSSMISDLSGPDIPPSDIQWAMDLPAGKALIEWLAAQVDTDMSEVGRDCNRVGRRACLEAVALEDEEVQKLKANDLTHLIECPQGVSDEVSLRMLSGYMLPSRQRERANYINAEADLLETDTETLKHRLRLTKTAIQKTSKMAENIQSAIDSSNDEIRQRQESLNDLSLQADTATVSTVAAARRVLNCFENKQKDAPRTPRTPHRTPQPRSHELKSPLSSISELRSEFVDLVAAELTQVSEAKKSLISAEDVKRQANSLQGVFSDNVHTIPGIKGKVPLGNAAEAVIYQDELARICDQLDSDGSLDELLENLSSDPHAKGGADVNVKSALERAWCLDQATILEFEEQILDTAQANFSTLLPPLQTLYDLLATSNTDTREAEALNGALIEELEDIADDVRQAKALSEGVPAASGNCEKETVLEAGLKDLLKSLKEYRTADTPPLVLLDRGDILSELESTIARMKRLEDKEETWQMSLTDQLSALSRQHDPLLTAIYQHSAMNTSPAFQPPDDVVVLENDTRIKADELRTSIVRLEKDLEMSSRTKKKLNAFVAKWGKTRKRH